MTPRAEGVYPKWATYPENSGLRDNLLTIDRVCGDGSVLSLTIARSEANKLRDFLNKTKRQ